MMSLWLDASHWLSNTVPQLPSLTALSLARHIGWAVVLACGVWRGWLGLRRVPDRWRAVLAGAVAMAALVPGPLGLAYWLGLAFQVPSVMTVGLAAVCLIPKGHYAIPKGQYGVPKGQYPVSNHRVFAASLVAVVWGWVLFFDTLALLPAFVYPWGYGNAAVMVTALGACLLWANRTTRALGAWGVLLVIVFAVTRLPSGNLWDALMDPWLWLFSHGLLARSVWRMRREKQATFAA